MTKRAILPLVAALSFGAFALLWFEFPALYVRVLSAEGSYPFWFPFLDTHAVLSAIECKRIGFDVYVANPCDVLLRPHIYSPLFLELSFLPITTRATAIVGTILGLGFVLSLAAVPPPRGRRGWLLLLLLLVSNMTVYAVERGNNDLLIFIAIAIAGRLMLRGIAARGSGYALIMLAALLKFYPVALLLLALREPPRIVAAIVLIAAAVLAMFTLHYGADLAAAIAMARGGLYFTDFFGAANLPFGLGVLASPLGDIDPRVAQFLTYLPWLLLAALVVRCLRDAVGVAANDDVRARFAALPAPQALFLAIGAVAIVACFFAGQNIGYRGIFFLFLLPGLCALGDGDDGRRFRFCAAAIVFLAWSEFFRHAIGMTADAMQLSPTMTRNVQALFWLAKELLWWRVIASLAGLVLCFAATSELGASVLAWLAPMRKAVR